MAVSVILTMASRGFKIFGSGTSLTSSFCFPYQQFAFINSLVLNSEADGNARLYVAYLRLSSRTLALCGGNFARFNDCLEAPEIHLCLDTRFFSEQFRNRGTKLAPRRVVVNGSFHNRAVFCCRFLKLHGTGVRDIGFRQRLPGNTA